MLRFPRNKYYSLLRPRLDWIQVEVSSYCNASCSYCPNTVYRDSWQNRHMSMEIFMRLKPVFKKTRLIFLQGWGEPFMNRDFFRMVSAAKAAGCEVGTSTNGTLLDEDAFTRLVEHQVDVVAFSLAGVTPEANDRLREGTTLQGVLSTIRSLNRLKVEMRSAKPNIHIAYLLVRSGLDELGRLPELLKGTGVNQVVISTLDFVPTHELLEESLNPKLAAEFNEMRLKLDEVVQTGGDYDMEINYQIPSPTSRRIWCSENVHRSLFVSSAGEVSPCVFTNIPATRFAYFANGQMKDYNRLTFGNIQENSITSIWRSSDYRSFRDALYTIHPPDSCAECPKLRIA